MMDLVVKNGLVYDGSGNPPIRADIMISGEKIADVRIRPDSGEATLVDARCVIDASGCIVTPGFIDVHSHSDVNILANPQGESKLRQGITTEIVGNCGESAFPLRGAALAEARLEAEKIGVEIDWTTADGYFERIEKTEPAFNVASFVGHGNIRGGVIGYNDRKPTPEEMQRMKHDVREAVETGALGMSTGLIYSPGLFADVNEIVELQRASGAESAMYSSHVRGEGDTLMEAASEFLEVIKGSGCAGQFSHLKASAPRNWGKVERVIEKIEQANSHGAQIHFDKYPYIASSTSLSSLLPRWARDGGRDKTLERLNNPTLREKIIEESIANNEGKDGWYSVLISDAGVPEFESHQGKSLGQIADERGVNPDDLYLELLIKSGLSTAICNFTMSQDETDRAILHPLGMVCTDSGCRATYGPLSRDVPHPRTYGTFPKFFRDYVKERPLLTLEAAVAKVTSFPCGVFGLRNRGLIQPDYFADILVIDWNRFEDRAQFGASHHYSEGIDAIIVNGTLTVRNGQQTGQRNGHALRRNA